MAVFLTLRKLDPPQGTHILLNVDNQTAVSCLRRGGSRSPALNGVVLVILKLLRKKNLFLTPSYIQGVRNVLADSLSRNTIQESEWRLSKETFQQVLIACPDLQVDLFATKENHQLDQYVSPFVDPNAVATDALSIDWNIWERIYLFPLMNLISKVLTKLTSFKGVAVLVAPSWPNSQWFPQLMQLRPKEIKFNLPVIQQIVGTETLLGPSFLTHNLRIWIF